MDKSYVVKMLFHEKPTIFLDALVSHVSTLLTEVKKIWNLYGRKMLTIKLKRNLSYNQTWMKRMNH